MDQLQKVNDEPIIVQYDSNTDSLEWSPDGMCRYIIIHSKTLYWKVFSSSKGHALVEIPATNVIAATSKQLLYVDRSGSDANDESTSKTPVVKSLEGSELPEDFVKRYTIGPYVSQIYPLHVVVSIASGTGLAKDFYESSLRPLLDHLGYLDLDSCSIHYTKSENTVTQLTKTVFVPAANAGKKQWIILLSGDGGIVDVVNAILGQGKFAAEYTRPRVSLLPLGTGNALANSLRINQDNTMGLAAILRGELGPLPIFKSTFSSGARLLYDEARQERELLQDPATGKPTLWGAVVCSWGLHATLVGDSDTSEYRKYGVERFQMAAKASLFPQDGSNPHPYCGRVSIMRKGSDSWQELERKEHAYVLTTFVSNLEKTFTISPASKPLDGQLRLIQFGPISGDEVMKIMMAAYDNGKHVEDPRVSYEEIEGLKIQFDEHDATWRRVCIDGKIVRVERGGFVKISKEARDVLDVFHM